MKIGNHDLNRDGCLIIGELSANHHQELDIAIKSIRAIAKSGANAVKLQTYTPDTITIDCDNEFFRIGSGTMWDGRTLYDLYKEAYTPWEWHEELFRVAKEEGLLCFSTPFDNTAVDFLEKFNPPAYKIASFEITDTALIRYVASKGKPIIISTGIAEKEDIDLAISVCREAGNNEIVLLKCTSSYPAPIEEANLLTIQDMKRVYGVVTGLSDHTMGITAPIVAATLGAMLIEKHFILDRSIGGPDAAFSLEPTEFTSMVRGVREAEKALGEITYSLTKKSRSGRVFSRSLFVVEDIRKGDEFTNQNIRSIRPGYGLHPKFLDEILGKKAQSDLKRGTPLTWEMISKV
jgi:pseudaminic acid synthase